MVSSFSKLQTSLYVIRDLLVKEKEKRLQTQALRTGNYLSSRPVSRQVLSASMCLTAVFGMGTGGTT